MPIIYLDLAEVNNVVTVHSTVAGRSVLFGNVQFLKFNTGLQKTQNKKRESLLIF